MTEKKLKKVLAAGESISVEFKGCRSALPGDLFETVCAFLNRIGGDLILGADDAGKVTGIDPNRIEQIKTDLVNLSNNPNKLDPPFILFPEEFTLDGKKIIYLRVPQSSQVHRSGQHIYDRNEDGDFKVKSSFAISRLYQKKSAWFTESKIYPFLRLSDFNESVFSKVRNLIQSHRPDHPWLTISNDEILRSAGLFRRDFKTGKEGYTLAAALLFANDDVLQQIVPAYKTDALLRIKDQDHYDDRREIRTNLVDAYNEIMRFIRAHLPDKFYMEGDIRVDLREKIFREVVANILIHREYTNAFPARLIIQRDLVTTENANNPVGHGPIDPDNFNPHPKNPAIVKFFQQLGRAEELGSGIRNIRKYLPLYSHNTHFELIEQDNFKTVLSFTDIFTDTFKKTSVKTVVKTVVKTREKILKAIKNNPEITTSQLMEFSGLTRRGVEWNLKKLKNEGKIRRVGPAKGGHWEIIKEEFS